ncbi:ImmA/IrrE family metallo-endopeptidase [Mesorhizobium muleiense]|uniref:ImmA/IrrE family metallo-endopeptidase n=1 Tax=Mesorhizobium muleiense TaxID=1004279 RepID=UPI001F211617|nr:hypothetical protein [Mesorhizobium muleiense]MCF6114057.1 hypothetical protein [Mesorhizobium muleiense]
MNDVFVSKAASANKIRILAEWVRTEFSVHENRAFDVIRFIELDLPKIFSGLHTYIEADEKMGPVRAFISTEPLGLVVSESIYEGASNGCMFSAEIILHEVGHLFLHHKYAALGLNSASGHYEERVKDSGLAHSAEWQATMFALCFLYPFSTLKKIQMASDVSKLYKINQKQANRVLKHVSRLKIRLNSTDTATDKIWLRTITGSLPRKNKQNSTSKLRSQLLLFFGNVRTAQNFRRPPAASYGEDIFRHSA